LECRRSPGVVLAGPAVAILSPPTVVTVVSLAAID
jgi:hypothetical protein